ncbi:MAG: hypothetical protein MMC23_008095 [Stictis urceolatum]|nr:hypothetical protein [Stictis urceolata]
MSSIIEKIMRVVRFHAQSILSQSPSTGKFDQYGTKWAQGLRGLAALMVCISHMLLVLDPSLFGPADENGRAKLLQLPFFRLGIQGSSWVAVFFIMLGFANALKALELRHTGDSPAALMTVAKAYLKQLLRLSLPAAAVTILSCILTNVHLEEQARYSKSRWLHLTTPHLSPDMISFIGDLMDGILTTWSFQSKNEYDASQWVLKYFALAYVLVNTVLLLTIPLSPRSRACIIVATAVASIKWSDKFGDPFVGFTSMMGVAFAELIFNPKAYAAIKQYSNYISPPCIFLGSYLMSYPPEYPERAAWSAKMQAFEPKLITRSNYDERFYCAIGAVLFFTGCFASPKVHRVFTFAALEWLGSVSYSLYLLHGTLMRTLFSWCMFLGAMLVSEEYYDENGNGYVNVLYPYPGWPRTILSLIIYAVALAVASQTWTKNIEPMFASWSEVVQKFLVRE